MMGLQYLQMFLGEFFSYLDMFCFRYDIDAIYLICQCKLACHCIHMFMLLTISIYDFDPLYCIYTP